MCQVPAINEKKKLWQISVKENVVSVKLVVAEQAKQCTHECFQSSISARYANELKTKHKSSEH